MSRYFITATGTGVGKTLVTAALCHQLRQAGKFVKAIKPVISGWDPYDPNSDTAILLRSMELPQDESTIAEVSPFRFAAPLSPDMAAARESRVLRLEEVVFHCYHTHADIVLAEGVGGIMVPLNAEHTVCDWMQALCWPVLLVAGSYLGSLSHTLTALEVLRKRQIFVQALIVSESEESPVSLDETCQTLRRFVHKPIFPVPRFRYDGGEPWRRMPNIQELVECV
ncbi:MAG: dethiobiotin synthase [Hyphomicrobiales bacterium]|nr:dethiobiotin synthase [Rickettsiales bacterium]MCP5361830.1 dethiobiotin synthase [Hyphomicrobiales bacterium]